MSFRADEVKTGTIGPLRKHGKRFDVVITRNRVHRDLGAMEDLERPYEFGKRLEAVLFLIHQITSTEHSMDPVLLGQLSRPAPSRCRRNGRCIDT